MSAMFPRSPSTLDWLACLVFSILMVAGCGKKSDGPNNLAEPENPSKSATNTDSKPSDPVSPTTALAQGSAKRDRLHQSFQDATHENPPRDERPPDQTITGKATGKLFLEVKRIWDDIRFVTLAGQPLAYSAVLHTELGEIEIELKPELAPNHVRNFVALGRVGYYDGLAFERVHEIKLQDGTSFQEIEAGCPRGTGNPMHNSIGYWLKPEFDPSASHEEGTVGFCHGYEADTAACRFYITLCKAPYLDGNFTVIGKVRRGLDVARKIWMGPTIEEEQEVGSQRPLKPVILRKVTIHSRE